MCTFYKSYYVWFIDKNVGTFSYLNIHLYILNLQNLQSYCNWKFYPWVIRFLWTKQLSAIDIYCELCVIHSPNNMSISVVLDEHMFFCNSSNEMSLIILTVVQNWLLVTLCSLIWRSSSGYSTLLTMNFKMLWHVGWIHRQLSFMWKGIGKLVECYD